MPGVSLSGSDTLIINGRLFADFGDGDVANLEFPNDVTNAKVGKNGNVTIALNNQGRLMNMTLRLLRAGPDDAFLNALYNDYLADPPTFELLDGSFIKRVGDGDGNAGPEDYECDRGYFRKAPGSSDNADGNTDQGIVVWDLAFARAIRAIV